MILSLALLLGTISRLSSSAAASLKSMNSLRRFMYEGLGCNESYVFGEDITTSLAVMEENLFCEGDAYPGQAEASYGKFTTTCDDADKTVMIKWHSCNTTDCSICGETILSGTSVSPMSVWDAPTEETCFEVDVLPPYDPSWNATTMSYRFIDDPSTYTSIIVENSCISKSLALAGGNSIPSSKPSSSGEWVGLNARWYCVVASVSVGFALLLGESVSN
jgi:hypothetical protein